MCNVEQPWRYGAFCSGRSLASTIQRTRFTPRDYKAYFDQHRPPYTDKLNGKPLASGEKVTLGAGGNLMGGDDHLRCTRRRSRVQLIRGFRENHGDDTAQRHGFVLDPQRSWTF